MVLEGVARIACGDRVIDAKAGDAIMLPRQIPHAWGNRSDRPLRFVAIVLPGGAEEAMRVIAAGGVKDLPALAESFGVTVLGRRSVLEPRLMQFAASRPEQADGDPRNHLVDLLLESNELD